MRPANDSQQRSARAGRILRALLCAGLLAYSSSGAIDSSLSRSSAEPNPQLTITRSNQQLTIRGVISSDAGRQILKRTQQEYFAGDRPGFDVQIAAPLPPRWSLLAEVTLASLAGVPYFEATITPEAVDVKGIVASIAEEETILAGIKRALPSNMQIRHNFQAIPAGRHINDLCTQRFEAQTSTRKVSFTTSTAELGSGSAGLLDALVEIALDCPAASFVIVGHTDDRGSEAHNLALAQERAEAAAHYMQRRGISASRLRTASMGSAQPIADNTSALGRNSNRRLEFLMNFDTIESDSPNAETSVAGSGLQ